MSKKSFNSQEIGDKIRFLRLCKGLSQENVANMIYITQSGYSKIERGERGIRLDLLDKLATILGLDLSRLIAYCKGTVTRTEILKDMDSKN